MGVLFWSLLIMGVLGVLLGAVIGLFVKFFKELSVVQRNGRNFFTRCHYLYPLSGVFDILTKKGDF